MQGMLFSLMILGAFLKKKGIITDEGKRVIADLVIFVTLPCSIIESFEVELSMDILKSGAQARGGGRFSFRERFPAPPGLPRYFRPSITAAMREKTSSIVPVPLTEAYLPCAA